MADREPKDVGNRREVLTIPLKLSRPTVPVALMFLGAGDRRLLSLQTKVTDLDREQLHNRVKGLGEIDLRPGAQVLAHNQLYNYASGAIDVWARSIDTWMAENREEPTIKGALESIFAGDRDDQKTGERFYYHYLSARTQPDMSEDALANAIAVNRKRLITKMIDGARDIDGRIDLEILSARLAVIGKVIPIDQRDVIYEAMAQANLSTMLALPGIARAGVIDNHIAQGGQELAKGQEKMFTSLAEAAQGETLSYRRFVAAHPQIIAKGFDMHDNQESLTSVTFDEKWDIDELVFMVTTKTDGEDAVRVSRGNDGKLTIAVACGTGEFPAFASQTAVQVTEDILASQNPSSEVIHTVHDTLQNDSVINGFQETRTVTEGDEIAASSLVMGKYDKENGTLEVASKRGHAVVFREGSKPLIYGNADSRQLHYGEDYTREGEMVESIELAPNDVILFVNDLDPVKTRILEDINREYVSRRQDREGTAALALDIAEFIKNRLILEKADFTSFVVLHHQGKGVDKAAAAREALEREARRAALDKDPSRLQLTPKLSARLLQDAVDKLDLEPREYGPLDLAAMQRPYVQSTGETCFIAAGINATRETDDYSESRRLEAAILADAMAADNLFNHGVSNTAYARKEWAEILQRHLRSTFVPLSLRFEPGRIERLQYAEEMLVTELFLGNTIVLGGNLEGKFEWLAVLKMKITPDRKVSFFCTIPRGDLNNEYIELPIEEMSKILGGKPPGWREPINPQLLRVGIQMPDYSVDNYRNRI